MWMACSTQQEIADAESLTTQGLGQLLKEMADLPKLSKSQQAAAEHATDFDMWMACSTQQEIADREDVHKDSVSEVCQKMADLPKSDKAAADHATDFDPPIYNIWKQQTVADVLKDSTDIGELAKSGKAAAAASQGRR